MVGETVAPIAIALLNADSDEPDRKVPCCICGKETYLAGFLVASIKLWNASPQYIKSTSDLIKPSDLEIACDGECNQTLYARRHTIVQQENATTLAYLAMLHVGKYNPESLAWLRQHGCARYVERVLAKEGTAKINGQ